MARRRKNPAGEAALLVIGGVVAAIAAIPKEAWVVFGVLGAISFVVWLFSQNSGTKSSDSSEHTATSSSDIEPFVTVGVPSQGRSRSGEELRGDPIPAHWIPKGHSVQVGNWVIKAGMLYVGSDLRAPNGQIDPALIEPRARTSQTAGHYSQRQTDYWPSYSTISPEARATYLSWLSSGRDDPTADIGYVFLYFYGLERRALIDAREDPVARDELPQIEAEVARLLDVYGDNRSFLGYAGSFLEFLECQRMCINAWSPPDVMKKRGDLPLALKVGLGKFAKSALPLPACWAFAWIKYDFRIGCPRAMERCPSEFEKLFTHQYAAAFGKGMKLPLNRTKLQIAYKPASAGFAGQVMAPIAESLPDVTAVVAPIKKLEAIVEECAEALAPYSRFLGKDPSGAGTLDANLLLPRLLWPASAQVALDELDKRIGDGLRVMTLGELSTALGGGGNLTRNKARALAHALQEMRIGIEPDILAGARTPKADDKIILFRSDPEDASQRESNLYRAASVSLDLACSVAMADGKPHPNELQLLIKQIDGWVHLSTAQRKRLRARLRMALDSPPTLASLRSKLEAIPADGKRAIAHLMATLAQADGVVAPAEVKLLEKIYKVLGLETQAVYSDLHMQAMEPASSPTTSTIATPGTAQPVAAEASASGGLNLDAARIAALQRETAEVSALLSSVFAVEAPVSQEQMEERDEASSIIEPGPLGLDPEHSVFLRLIMTRDSWSRHELTDAAADMELMLDGAIERINEAAFEHLDAPLLEGDDPIEVVRDVMEKVTA
jgi:tellurite resistance protein